MDVLLLAYIGVWFAPAPQSIGWRVKTSHHKRQNKRQFSQAGKIHAPISCIIIGSLDLVIVKTYTGSLAKLLQEAAGSVFRFCRQNAH